MHICCSASISPDSFSVSDEYAFDIPSEAAATQYGCVHKHAGRGDAHVDRLASVQIPACVSTALQALCHIERQYLSAKVLWKIGIGSF
jgi:hypothetical protein